MTDQVLDAYNDDPYKNKNQTVISFKPNSGTLNDRSDLDSKIREN